MRDPLGRLFPRLPREVRVALDWILTIGGAILIVFALKAWVVNPYRIPSSSMEPTLHCAKPAPGCEAAGGFFSGVGTVIFNMVTNPVDGTLYVSNTEARNEVRFEGPGIIGGSTVRGHLHEARISVLASGVATPRHLNKHIDYAVVPSPPGVKERSLATPLGMAVSDDGEVAGSVSGGCVEGAVVTAALEVLAGERERGVITFGYSDDEAFAVGLTCGGTIHLFLEPLDW